jgi:hypothetical protein
VVFFPVRHHSPAAARLLGDVARLIRPASVLIEAPSDFEGRIEELYLPHQPPVAIYSYVRLPDGRRRGAFYPFCEHSPEWQALRVAREVGAKAGLIDLPWADIARLDGEEESNRFGDSFFRRSKYVRQMCERAGVEGFDGLWDALAEIDPNITPSEYLTRCHHLCASLRLLETPGRLSDRCREAYMAERVRREEGRVLVVLGGAHCLPVWARLNNVDLGEMTSPPQCSPAPPSQDEERGIALTQYSFERMDNLTGYEAGMPNPGFYQRVWDDRRAGRTQTHLALLQAIALRLREAKQAFSAADLIAAEANARALAMMRGHAEVWRTDLAEGLVSSLLKEELSRAGRHPLLDAIHDVMRGGARGLLAEGTLLPPLVGDIRRQLREHGLEPREVPREVELALDDPLHRPRSRVMHRLRLLGVPGFDWSEGTDLAGRDDLERIWERWRLAWGPDQDARCIEAARYGASLADAATAILSEQADATERDAAKAALFLLDAALAGLTEQAAHLWRRVAELLRAEADFLNLAPALGHLLYLFRYDEVLATAGTEPVADLLREAYHRGLWLLEGLGSVSPREREAIDGVAVLRETWERCGQPLGLDRGELDGVLERVTNDPAQSPAVRGAALGALWSLGVADERHVEAQITGFGTPDRLGDFLTGLFALAREQVPRQPALLGRIHELVAGWGQDAFLAALPALRLAFTFFTPREKHHLALTVRRLLGLDGHQELAALAVDDATAAEALALEGKLFELAARYGLRGA